MSSALRVRILRTVFWAAVVFAFAMAIMPLPPPLPGQPSDKLQHIAAFLVLSTLGFVAYPRARPLHLGLWLSLFGALIEVVQGIPALHRDADIVDWFADTAAVTVVLVVLPWLRARWMGLAGRG